MSRRGNRQRRDRKVREYHHVDPGPPDTARASEHWRAILATMTGRGFASSGPPFAELVFAPAVGVDLDGPHPPSEPREKTETAIVARTLELKPS